MIHKVEKVLLDDIKDLNLDFRWERVVHVQDSMNNIMNICFR